MDKSKTGNRVKKKKGKRNLSAINKRIVLDKIDELSWKMGKKQYSLRDELYDR
ncbi:MAG: hypothetical protein HXY48_08740 [Ignavibacteriaceae bacterium]|jgi:hypothetical protein|nr:hypothetical protein [Ignavibacteriaceae bacterium]